MPPLVVFSHLRWNAACPRPQHLLARLAKHSRVVFIEEPTHSDDELPHFERWSPAENVEVLRPHTPVEAEGFHDDQLPVLRPLVADFLREQHIDGCVAWLHTPMALPLLAELNPSAVIYDCMDELSAWPDAPRQLRQRESALLRQAQLVLARGPSLYEAKGAVHPDVICVPSAVDVQHFSPPFATTRLDRMLQAEQIQGRIPGPRLGFYGVIDGRIDMELLAALADARPEWQIVMAGPLLQIDPARLAQRPNIHWLGQQPYALLPQMVADWDVCLLPFAVNETTRFLSPPQTVEFMAAEKPIVSTALRDVVSLYGDVVRIGHDAASFVDACRWALSETEGKRSERLADMAATVARSSWDHAAQRVHRALQRVLSAQTTAFSKAGAGEFAAGSRSAAQRFGIEPALSRGKVSALARATG